MIRTMLSGVFICLLTASQSPALQKQASALPSNRIVLGTMRNGAIFSFDRSGSGDWGIEVSRNTTPWMMQEEPAQVEIFRSEGNISDLAAGYESVQKEADGVVAKARVAGEDGAAFAFTDRWKIAGDVVILSRAVTVTKGEGNAGFYSAIRLSTAPTVSWSDLDYLAPGVLYGESFPCRRQFAGRDAQLQRQALRDQRRLAVGAAVRDVVS